MLDKQVSILSLDTGSMYTNTEMRMHMRIHTIRSERRILKTKMQELENQIDSEIAKLPFELDNDYKKAALEDIYIQLDNYESLYLLISKYRKYAAHYSHKTVTAKSLKQKLLDKLSRKTELNIKNSHKQIRCVRKDIYNEDGNIKDSLIVSLFDSFLTRTLGCEYGELCKDIIIMQVYFFSIFKDCLYNGFIFEGEKYIYLSSSAGQIRTKRALFIKESIWKKYEKTLMCGLTVDSINAKGGCNSNKYLAYMALTNSATDEWSEFDIDKTIVVNDFETQVLGTYDFIDDTNFSITRKTDYVPITHTDGCGIILPGAFGVHQKNKMIRLPFVKGLLSPFDFVRFIRENENASPIVKDIYGIEHNILAEGIEVILTKSMFKMWAYYNDWSQYKQYFKEYNCRAAFTNPEEDKKRSASINYQMLQSLTDITENEMRDIAKLSINKLNHFCDSKKSLLDFFGVVPENIDPTYFQQGLMLYENLLNDEYTKKVLRDNKNSIVKRYRAGKLKVKGKYTFVLPDLYAFCEYLFLGQSNPKGLLADGEVYCKLFPNKEKLDCLRSPHLYKEHAVRKNIAYVDNEKSKVVGEWFDTQAIYTSCFDLISKILQQDCDGDTLLVIPDDSIIKVAERNMNNIVPLYYIMKKALPAEINNENIYKGLIAAFTGCNIGQFSNDISKIWNSKTFVNGTDEEIKTAIQYVACLTAQNNYLIDGAKTLYIPEFPSNIKSGIQEYTKKKLPYFFQYAKDKKREQVEDKNKSFVNQLESIIPSPKISMKKINVEEVDYTMLMNDKAISAKAEFTERGRIIEDKTEELILKYIELAKVFIYKVDASAICKKIYSPLAKQNLIFNQIRKTVKNELKKIEKDENVITDKLVDFLYNKRQNESKGVLWICYGDYLIRNLKRNGCKNILKERQCKECGNWFYAYEKDTMSNMCADCYREYRKNRKLETQRERRKLMKSEQEK